MVNWKGIVGKSFSLEAFGEYLETLNFDDWRPQFVVLHNTGVPTLAQYPNGITEEYIENIVPYYRDKLGWSGGPHLFIDDHRIWAFTPLTVPGVHANSWNAVSIGVEMLGDYDKEEFDRDRGALVKANAVAAIATLSSYLHLDPGAMRLHRENPGTTHHCPGDNVDKATFIRLVKDFLTSGSSPDFTQLSASQAGLTQTKFKPDELSRGREYLPSSRLRPTPTSGRQNLRQ